jgi:chemotaxis protein CheX
MGTYLDPKGRTVLALEESMDVTQAVALANSLLSLRGKDLIIDASSVKHCGAQCGQVLVAARKSWANAGKGMRFGSVSPEFLESLRLLGLTSHLPIDEHHP